MMNLRTNS